MNPHLYRVKGRGDSREIYDDEQLVGTLERRERVVVRWSGSDTSIRIRKTTETWWRAVYPDGSPVLKANGRRQTSDTIKGWRTPDLWRKP